MELRDDAEVGGQTDEGKGGIQESKDGVGEAGGLLQANYGDYSGAAGFGGEGWILIGCGQECKEEREEEDQDHVLQNGADGENLGGIWCLGCSR